MALKKFKPITPSLRTMTVSDFAPVTRTSPEKSLVRGKKQTGGRNNKGRTTVRFRGGGVKRRYRMVDFKRDKKDISAKVVEIEYDPNRSAYIALLHYLDGEKSYILAPNKLKKGDVVVSGESVEFNIGNAMPLKSIPLGEEMHNIELVPGQGGKLVRSAGQFAILRSKSNGYAQLKLPSGEIRMVHENCYATLGSVSNMEHKNIVFGKAGRKRYLGRRPHVRGVAMNPVDHPMGEEKEKPLEAVTLVLLGAGLQKGKKQEKNLNNHQNL